MLVERLDIYDFKVTLTLDEFAMLKRATEYGTLSLELILSRMIMDGIINWLNPSKNEG